MATSPLSFDSPTSEIRKREILVEKHDANPFIFPWKPTSPLLAALAPLRIYKKNRKTPLDKTVTQNFLLHSHVHDPDAPHFESNSLVIKLNPPLKVLKDEIKHLNNPHLIKQMLELEQLASSSSLKNCPKQYRSSFLQFCLQIATSDNSLATHTPNQLLGKIIFLAENDLRSSIFHTVHYSTSEALDWIEKAFNEKLEKVQDKCSGYFKIHAKFGVQSPGIAKATAVPIAIAKMLITSSGFINSGIIPAIRLKFLHSIRPIASHNDSLAHGLYFLEHSTIIQKKLEAIDLTPLPNSPGNEIVRTVLSLKTTEPMTSLHTKQTVLAAMLSHLRQGTSGTCFATSLAISLMSCHLEKCLQDFISLLQTNELKRNISNTETSFPFIVKMGNENLDKPFMFDRKGYVIKNGKKVGFIGNIPGIKAVCDILCLPNPNETLDTIIVHQFAKKKNCDQIILPITTRKLLKYMITTAYRELPSSSKQIEQLFNKACFIFESQTSNALLKVWENSISGMAEGIASSQIKSAIITATLNCLEGRLKLLDKTHHFLIPICLLAIKKQLLEKIQLIYDPFISAPFEFPYNYPTSSGFVLYEKDTSKSLSNWNRADNPFLFQKYITEIVNNAETEVFLTHHNDCDILRYFLEHLKFFIKSEDFLLQVLKKYPQSKPQKESSAIEIEKLEYAPWISKTGNDTISTLQTYLECKNPISTKKIMPKNPEKLLAQIIDIGKSNTSTEKLTYQTNPCKLTPMRVSGVHAFSLMLGHGSIFPGWNSILSSEKWIEKNVITPGKEIAKIVLDDLSKNQLLEAISNGIVTEKQRDYFKKLSSEIPSGLSIKNFRNEVLSLIKKMDSSIDPLKTSRGIDSLICTHLPLEAKRKFQDATVVFADTNWFDGTHDIHFCFLVNPGTEKLELWEVYDDKSTFFALNQDEWVQKHIWEFYNYP